MATKNNKYYPLCAYLKASGKERLVLSRTQIEKILGFKLPQSSKISSWWANDPDNGHTQACGWVDAGYFVKTESNKFVFIRNG